MSNYNVKQCKYFEIFKFGEENYCPFSGIECLKSLSHLACFGLDCRYSYNSQDVSIADCRRLLQESVIRQLLHQEACHVGSRDAERQPFAV